MPAVTARPCEPATWHGASHAADTAMCSDGLTQRWEHLSEKEASVVAVKENRHACTDSHVLMCFSASATSH